MELPKQADESPSGWLGFETGRFYAEYTVKQIADFEQFQHVLSIDHGRIGKHNFTAPKPDQCSAQSTCLDYHSCKVRELVRVVQKVMRVCAVVAHEAVERCPVSLPIFPAQGAGFGLVKLQVRHQVLRHGAIDVRENMCAGVM